ncbi:MAG TPA: protoglobin domain-containing protein [Thermomicrobiales bacterium]|nr:protoglobin domain-containing protein [Thermomicrobiales bacterium]
MTTPELLCQKFTVTPHDLELVRAAGAVLLPELSALIERWYEWLGKQPEMTTFFDDASSIARVKHLQAAHWTAFFDGTIDESYIAHRRHVGAVHANIDLPNDSYFAGIAVMLELFTVTLENKIGDRNQLTAISQAISKVIFLDAYLAVDEIARIQKERIAEHSRAVMEMSTPVTPIWEGILLLPLVGVIDSMRTADIMNKSLTSIAEMRAKVFVLDISGVGAVDTAVANQLIKITKATRLLGCEPIISGLSPSIARTMVELGVNVGEIRTTATLRDGFEIALKMMGMLGGLTGQQKVAD